MTAHAMEADIQRSKQAGMNDHITKPIDPDILYRTLITFLLGNTAVNTLQNGDAGDISDSDANQEIFTQLQTFTTINADKALRQIGGRKDLYISLIKDFKREQHSLHQQIQQLFSEKDWQTLYRVVHSLKSNAAYIGAYGLSEVSATLEASISANEQNETVLENVLSVLDLLLKDLQCVDIESSAVSAAVEFSVQRLQQGLSETLPLLKAYDFAVEEVILALQTMCSTSDYESRIDIIAEHINDIEYEEATNAINELLSELEEVSNAS